MDERTGNIREWRPAVIPDVLRTGMGIRDLDGVMITLGEDYGSDLAPQLNTTRELVLSTNESVLTEFEARVGFWPNSTGLQPVGLAVVQVLKLPAHVLVTTQRLVVHWKNVRRDRSAGSFVERRLMGKLLDLSEGPSAIAAQMPYRYIAMVDLRSGLETRHGSGDAGTLDVWAGMESADVVPTSTAMWQFLDIPRQRAAEVANTVVKAASSYRLAAASEGDADLSGETRTTLEANRVRPRPQQVNVGVRYLIPGGSVYTA